MNTLDELRTGKLKGARAIRLSCGLETFPQEIFDLADSLEMLDLSGNNLTSLPPDLPRLRHLHTLFCSQNQFETLPPVLGDCKQLDIVGFKTNRISTVAPEAIPANLRWLILTDNRIGELPDTLGACARLQKLMLAGNRLTGLPATLRDCHRLELVRLSANRLSAFPQWLLDLPRLSWLAFSGNPFNARLEQSRMQQHRLPSIDWHALEIEDLLGEGASGTIYRATVRAPQQQPQTIAVKLFKGMVTSDGFPIDEAVAATVAGPHPALVSAIADIAGHPSGRPGLAFPLITPEFRTMAGPPSLNSCTRDVYAADTSFTLAELLGVLRDVTSAVAHLHAHGVMHGDLYAHNILRAGARAILGDFGAASQFHPGIGGIGDDLQRIEARALGCLFEELMLRCDALQHPGPMATALDELRTELLSERRKARPLFSDISARLNDLACD